MSDIVEVTKHIVVFWSKDDGYTCKLFDNESEVNDQRGFGDYAGSSCVVCKIPDIEAINLSA